jgi:hypothetical protein
MTIQGPCDACSLIDKDTSKKTITKCSLCEANLCGACKGDVRRRAEAAAIRASRTIAATTRVIHTHITSRRGSWWRQRTPE